jgi:hypothetical protein
VAEVAAAAAAPPKEEEEEVKGEMEEEVAPQHEVPL